MSVDDDHRRTAPERRKRIVSALTYAFAMHNPDSPISRLKLLLAGPDRRIVGSFDIDGLVSSMMLSAVTDWKVTALILRSGRMLVHPSHGATGHRDGRMLLGLDVFSTWFPSISNHPLLWGDKRLGASEAAAAITKEFDYRLIRRTDRLLFFNPSFWAGIQAATTDTSSPAAGCYRYPLGTAQVLLAALEVLEKSPRFFDRQFLPWLVANCDGGLQSIGKYSFNVPMWWSALAAAAGPASLSEQLWRQASAQRPGEFEDAVHRLRSENPAAASALDDVWNLKTATPAALAAVCHWIQEISGWPDPFASGVDSLADWLTLQPDQGTVLLSGLPTGGIPELRRGLLRASRAIHMSFSFFDNRWRLGWLARP